eukprot:gene1580-3053_t
MNSDKRFGDTFVPRMTNHEVKEIVHSIPHLKAMFKSINYEGDLFGSRDYTDGILYLSRVNLGGHHPQTGDLNNPDGEKDTEDTKDLQEIKSESATTTLSFNLEKKRRFAMSLATLAAKANKRVKMCEDGAIQSLIKLSAINDTPIRRCCAAAFSCLASEPKIRTRMIDEGAFSAIIALSAVPHRIVKADCCRALCNLCCEDGHEHRAVKENAPYAIIQIAQAEPTCVEICLLTLLNLSCVADKYTRMEEVTDTLIHFTMLPLNDKEDIILVSAMCNLSALRNNQLRLVEDGCLRILEKTVKSPNTKLRILSSEVIRNLTTDVRTRGKLVDQNIVSVLLGMSKDELEPVKTACVQAFYNLSRDSGCREKVVTGGAVTVIIKMSMEKLSNVERDRTASRILRILCGDRSLAQKLVRDGIVKALMSLIKTDDSVIRQYCAESICSLFQNEVVLARLIDQGAVGVLVSLSHNNTDSITGDWCSFALYHLATNKLCPPSMLANGILPCLIKLCDASTVRTKQFCGAALRIITQQKIVEASSAIPILVHMLRYETDQMIKTNCASALYNLAEIDAHCDQMLSAGALMPVVRLTQSDYMQTKIKCAAILSRLSIHEQYYEQFGREDVLRVLLDLSCVEHTLTQQRVVIAMSNLTQFQSLRLMLQSLHATKYIIALASKPDEQIRRGCAAIICNLSYDYGGEKDMVEGGVLSTLLITALVTSDQVETKIICVKALVNLQCDRSLYKIMVDQGLIWGLSTLALLDDSSVLTLCAKALCNLSGDFATEMLNSAVAIRAIIKLITQNNLDMQKDGGRALTNLLLQTKDTDEDFRRKAVAAIQPMANSKDEEVIEMCILCLCLASQSESCRANIVNLGMMRMINASTIFTKPIVSYAYLTMFGNIANNPLMRTQLLDEYSMDRFMHICNSHDPYLDMAVAKALYCISCAPENIPKLAQQKTLPIISTIWHAEYEKSQDLIHHLVACLYNMTTHTEAQCMLVSQGIVQVISELWPRAKEEMITCRLLCTAVCQLGCGNVNSAKMVNDGCAPIICFVTSRKLEPKYASYLFPVDINDRCAAALRNILCLIANQEVMERHGAIRTIMGLAIPEKEFMPLPPLSVRHNCASALRSISYNPNMRNTLVSTGAISIILADHNLESDPDLAMNANLLREVEAESWCNGSRGTQKESKSPFIEPAPIYQDLLGGTPNVVLDVPTSYSVLQKFLVYVYLEEPPLESEEYMKGLDLSLKDLESFKDEESIYPPTRTQPKQAAELTEEPLRRRYLMEIEEESLLTSTEHSSVDAEGVTEEGGILVAQNSGKSDQKGGRKASTKQLKVGFVESAPLPDVIDGRRRSNSSMHRKLSTSLSTNIDLPTLNASQNGKRKKHHPNKDEMFKGLVALINHAKARGADVNTVVDKWNSLSKF